jgi:HlyD family secretion protein
MGPARRFGLTATGLVLATALMLWVAHSRQANTAQKNIEAPGPLMARGYTDAPAGTVSVGGYDEGGSILRELRVSEGQKVKHDDIIAVLSNFPTADIEVRRAEAALEKAKSQREAMVSGFRTALIAMQEVNVRSATNRYNLQALEIARSGKLPEIKDIELRIARHHLELEQEKLRVQKEQLQSDVVQIDGAIKWHRAVLDNAQIFREHSMVRSPLDGVVIKINVREGGLVPWNTGVATIVDLSKLRILADLDDWHLGRVAQGGKVAVTFVGSKLVRGGKVVRVAQTVKRLQFTAADSGTIETHTVQVEIELDDPSNMPQMLGREAHVTFLE